MSLSEINFSKINKLAFPALIAGISEPILSLTDAAIVGNMPANATVSLAAVGIVATFFSMLIWVFGQCRSAISSLVSQYYGAKKLNDISKLPAQAGVFILFLSLLILATTYPIAEIIFKLYSAKGMVLNMCVEYYRIRVFGLPFTLYTIIIYGTFRGLQNTYYPMVISIIGTLINIVLDYVLVYGLGTFVPAFGLQGAAWASVVAQVIMASVATFYIVKKTNIPLLPQKPLHPEFGKFYIMVLNLFVRTLALNITLYFATSLATSYGTTYIAAYTIAINLWFFGAFLIDGYSSAGNILSGKFYGAKKWDELRLLSQKLIKAGIFLGFVMGLLGALFYNTIPTFFTKDAEVVAHFKTVFWIVLLMQPFSALAFIFDGVFKGLGKTAILRNLLLITTFVVFLPIVYLFDSYHFKIQGIFWAIFVWIVFRGVPLIYWFNKKIIPKTYINTE